MTKKIILFFGIFSFFWLDFLFFFFGYQINNSMAFWLLSGFVFFLVPKKSFFFIQKSSCLALGFALELLSRLTRW